MAMQIMMNHKASPRLRELVTTERTMSEDEEMLEEISAMDERDHMIDYYNPTCMLAQLGISWWRDVVPHLDENFVLRPAPCNELAAKIMESMPPRPDNVLKVLGPGTELQYALDTYPDMDSSKIVRDFQLPYEAQEQGWLYLHLGMLIGTLHNGAQNEGLLLSP